MKKIALISAIALLIVSCGQKTKQSEDGQKVSASPAEAKPEMTTLDNNLDVDKKGYYAEVNSFIADVVKDFESIEDDRKRQLKKLALYIKSKKEAGEEAKIVYICTHNSRRSHMSQLWGMVAADYYGVKGISTYSGGTEATAFNPRSVACLNSAGFKIEPKTKGEIPIYTVSYSDSGPTVEAFSKKYTHESNPSENFAAVMTCSDADKNCPTVEGASMRLAIPYVDPKVSDNTPEETATYDERCKQIATEEFYLFSQVI